VREGRGRWIAYPPAIAPDPKQAVDARSDADFAAVRAHEALVALLGA
jgi:hypothetical protein